MVIGLLQCQQTPCPPPSAQLGSIVFNGQFNPQFHEIPGEPYENFTVTVPSFQASFGTTTAQLATARLHLIGVCLTTIRFILDIPNSNYIAGAGRTIPCSGVE